MRCECDNARGAASRNPHFDRIAAQETTCARRIASRKRCAAYATGPPVRDGGRFFFATRPAGPGRAGAAAVSAEPSARPPTAHATPPATRGRPPRNSRSDYIVHTYFLSRTENAYGREVREPQTSFRPTLSIQARQDPRRSQHAPPHNAKPTKCSTHTNVRWIQLRFGLRLHMHCPTPHQMWWPEASGIVVGWLRCRPDAQASHERAMTTYSARTPVAAASLAVSLARRHSRSACLGPQTA